MTTTYLDPERVYELAKDYVVQVFPGDHDQRTSAVGFRSEDGTQLANSVSDPETIVAIAHRLVAIADEIAENQADDRKRVADQLRKLGPGATLGELAAHHQRLHEAGVVSLDQKRGTNAPTDDNR